MKTYIFPYKRTSVNTVIFPNVPVALSPSLNPMSVITNNADWVRNGTGVIEARYSDFIKYVQDFANKHAQRWYDPRTYGNYVVTLGPNGCRNFKAQ